MHEKNNTVKLGGSLFAWVLTPLVDLLKNDRHCFKGLIRVDAYGKNNSAGEEKIRQII